MPGPHGFAVRDPSSPRGFAGLCTSAEALAKAEATSFVCAPFDRSRAKPAPRSPARPTLPRPPHPIPTFVTMANAPPRDRTARVVRLIWVRRERKYFSKWGWTGNHRIEPFRQITQFYARVLPDSLYGSPVSEAPRWPLPQGSLALISSPKSEPPGDFVSGKKGQHDRCYTYKSPYPIQQCTKAGDAWEPVSFREIVSRVAVLRPGGNKI